MSTSPPPPPNENLSVEEVYVQLVNALNPSPPSLLEIDILPSTYPPHILSDPPALALPKSLLAKLFLHARQTFFSQPTQPPHIGDEGYDPRLQAASIILLFDPNHVTAANFRKRHLQQCSASIAAAAANQQHAEASKDTELQTQSLRAELCFLTSLLTSPLTKHTKSSTLWAHRLWLFQNFLDLIFEMQIPGPDISKTLKARLICSREMKVVMKAGERHPRNYYAWNYARQFFCILETVMTARGEYQDMLVDTGVEVHDWCLMHPRDISGWAFLMFWLGKVRDESRWCEQRESNKDGINGVVVRVVEETKEWVKKYDWKGESVEWFLEAVVELGMPGNGN